MSTSPVEMVEQIRRMVLGEVAFADLFAVDGVIAYPFSAPGIPGEIRGRGEIRAYFALAAERRGMLEIEGVEAIARQTDDPEVVVAEIEHHGTSRATGGPYRFKALGVIRVRDGEIVRYDDYMNPVALAQLMGRTEDLVAALG